MEKIEKIKIWYDKIQAHFGWFITVIVSLSIFSYLVGLLIEPASLTLWYDKCVGYLSSILKMLGSAGVTAAIFQVIIKSTAFINLLKDSLDVDKRHWKQYSDNKIKDVLKAIKEAKSFINISYVDQKEASIKLAKKAFLKQQKEISKIKSFDRTNDQNNSYEKNYIIEESRITKTIVKNGSEISTFELDIRFFRKGRFSFRMKNWTESEKIFYPEFKYFEDNDCDKRFFDYSFFSTYFNLTKKEKKIDIERYAKLKTIATDDINKKGFEILFTIDDTFDENDFLTLSLSTTIKGAYTEENITRIESGIDPKPFSSTSAPVGVRIITIQEEVYGNEVNSSRIRPTLTIDDENIDPTIETQSIFYKKCQWTIYYKDHEYEKIEYSVV